MNKEFLLSPYFNSEFQANSFLRLWLAVAFLLILSVQSGSAQLVNSKGAVMIVKTDSFIVKSGSFVNDTSFNFNANDTLFNGFTGKLINEGSMIIEGDFVNYDSIISAGNALFEIKGDWVNNALFVPDLSTVHLNGGNQLISGTTTTSFNNLTLSGDSVKTQTVNAIVLNQLDIGDVELATDTNIIYVINSDTLSILRATGFVSSRGEGRLSRATNDAFTYLFPLGSSIGQFRYRPVEITPSSNSSQTYELRMAHIDATAEGYDLSVKEPAISNINPFFYHLIDRTQGTDPVAIKFFYDPLEDGSWTGIGHWQNIPQWESTGSVVADTVGGFSTLALSGWSDFFTSPFALLLPSPVIDTTLTVIRNVRCFEGADGFITVSDSPLVGTPPFFYEWSNGPVNTNSIGGLTAGSYELTITDSDSAQQVYYFTVGQPISVTMDITVTHVSCKGGSDGSICIVVNGDFPPYNFVWSTGQTNDSCISGLGAGLYSVVITDANGCVQDSSITINEPNLLVASAFGTNVTCFEASDGFASVDVLGGTPGYSYEWSNEGTTQEINGLPNRRYDVTVTDAKSCTDTSFVVITQPDLLVVTVTEDDTIANGYGNDIAMIEALQTVGGTQPYSYSWIPNDGLTSPNSSSTNAKPDTTTTYVVTVTDDNGCTATDTVTITVDNNLYIFPDAFVPNGTGENRFFFPKKSPTVSVTAFKIFNRWGQLLYNDASEGGWNGKYQGKLQPMDTYIFNAEILLPDGSRAVEHGDFVLIR